jgi:general secretion pathway protein A
MYECFYGLRERPFDLLPNPRYLYLTARQREALSNLQYGLSTPRGLTLLIGEAGTGKTTLVQAALAELNRDNVECVLVSNPTLSRDEFFEYLATGFNLGVGAEQSKTRFLFEFRRHLQERHAAGRLSALLLDEAQSLPYELLEEVRLLSNIETATVKLLNVVLAGQPELADKLNEPRLRQLKQRISLRCEIEPLSFQETAAYVAGRLRIAGGNPAAIFSREAILAIHEASGGVPRLVNVICDNALIGGFAAETRPVLRSTVDEVCRDFDLSAAGPTVESTSKAFGHPARGAYPGLAASALLDSSSPGRSGPTNGDSTPPGLETAVEDAVARITRNDPDAINASANGDTPLFGAVGRKRFSFFR